MEASESQDDIHLSLRTGLNFCRTCVCFSILSNSHHLLNILNVSLGVLQILKLLVRYVVQSVVPTPKKSDYFIDVKQLDYISFTCTKRKDISILMGAGTESRILILMMLGSTIFLERLRLTSPE